MGPILYLSIKYTKVCGSQDRKQYGRRREWCTSWYKREHGPKGGSNSSSSKDMIILSSMLLILLLGAMAFAHFFRRRGKKG